MLPEQIDIDLERRKKPLRDEIDTDLEDEYEIEKWKEQNERGGQ